MALTRKSLKAMGLTDEQVDSIIEMHTETVDGLKEQIKIYKADAEKLPGVQKELDNLKQAGDGGYEEKYKTEKAAHDKLKSDIAAEKSKAAKESAARAYYQSKNITGKALEVAIRGSGTEISALELDGGKIKDASALDALVANEFSGLVSQTHIEGATTATPPANTGGGMTKADIYKKDEKGRYVMDAAERQNALAKMMSEKQT